MLTDGGLSHFFNHILKLVLQQGLSFNAALDTIWHQVLQKQPPPCNSMRLLEVTDEVIANPSR